MRVTEVTTLILTRKNETAELDTVTSSNVDAEVEYDESTKEYIIYTSSSQAQATAVLTRNQSALRLVCSSMTELSGLHRQITLTLMQI